MKVTSHLLHMKSAIGMLSLRIEALQHHVKKMHAGMFFVFSFSRFRFVCVLARAHASGEIPMDRAFLRHVANLISLLPTANTPDFQEEFFIHYNDAVLTAYLASLMKGVNTFNEMVDKFNAISDKHARMRGGFF
jgi:hypothetical protein